MKVLLSPRAAVLPSSPVMKDAWSWFVRQVKDPVQLRRWFEFFAILWIRTLELVVITMVAVYVYRGASAYFEAHGKLEDLLKALNQNWKATLILAGLLFVRPMQDLLGRVTEFTFPWAKVTIPPTIPSGKQEEITPQVKP
jgi:hypothetical protein